ncbi:MAG: hypothetical protein VX768_21660 [Planctomycetota bacterium]|nr:hypothetical protein [Planctomycetota bacterium]
MQLSFLLISVLLTHFCHSRVVSQELEEGKTQPASVIHSVEQFYSLDETRARENHGIRNGQKIQK